MSLEEHGPPDELGRNLAEGFIHFTANYETAGRSDWQGSSGRCRGCQLSSRVLYKMLFNPPHNIINFVSRWTQWTSNLINFCHWMLEERLNEINAWYFPSEAANLESAPDCWQVRRGTPVWPITLCLDQSQTFSAKMENAISGLEINHLRVQKGF